MSTRPETGPVLRIVRGDATEQEVAALVVVLALASTEDGDRPARGPASVWAGRRRATGDVGVRYVAGEDGWRTSGWPR